MTRWSFFQNRWTVAAIVRCHNDRTSGRLRVADQPIVDHPRLASAKRFCVADLRRALSPQLCSRCVGGYSEYRQGNRPLTINSPSYNFTRVRSRQQPRDAPDRIAVGWIRFGELNDKYAIFGRSHSRKNAFVYTPHKRIRLVICHSFLTALVTGFVLCYVKAIRRLVGIRPQVRMDYSTDAAGLCSIIY